MKTNSPEQQHERLKDVPEIVVSFDGSFGIQNNTSKQLHPNNCINEKQHGHQHTNIWKSLIGKNKINQLINISIQRKINRQKLRLLYSFTLNDCTNVQRSIRTLTLRLNNLMRRAARKSFRKPTETNLVASMMDPTTVTKSKTFHESLK